MAEIPLDLLPPGALNDLPIKDSVPGRSCVSIGCALCCKLPSIDFPEGRKKAGEWCSHCAQPECRIYPDRPQVCREFFCSWLGDAWWPESLNPVKTGCMVLAERITADNDHTGKQYAMVVLRVHEQRPGASANIERALRAVWDMGCAICIYTTHGTLRLIGFSEEKLRVVFCERDADLYGENRLPTVTKDTLRRWRGDWRGLAAECCTQLAIKEEGSK